MAKLILYNYYRSSASYRVRIALNLKGLNYDYRPVHLLNNGGEQHSPNYKNLNPAAQVPTLVDGSFVLSESMAIIDYLEHVYGGFKLFPQEPQKRAQVLRFCEVINSGIQPIANLKITQFLESRFPGNAKLREEWIQHWVLSGLGVIENLLIKNSGTYSFGGEITAADVFLVPQYFSAQRFKVNLNLFPNVKRVAENCNKLKSFMSAHPDHQPDSQP